MCGQVGSSLLLFPLTYGVTFREFGSVKRNSEVDDHQYGF
jgi:hypothetical protein